MSEKPTYEELEKRIQELERAEFDRKSVEAPAQASDEMYRFLVENSNDILWIFNLSSMTYTFCSKSVEHILGYTAEDVRGASLDDVFSKETKRRIQAAFGAVLAGDIDTNKILIEAEHKHKDGRLVWMEINAVMQKNLLGQPISFIGVSRDITEHKRSEEESRRLASVIRRSRELVNVATPDGMMFFLNDAGKKMLGISEKDVPQTNILRVIPEHLRDKVQQELLPTIYRDGHWEGELQYRNLKTGGLIDVHAIAFNIVDPVTGTLQFIANVSMDITERKRAEAELRESREVLQAVLNAIPVRVFWKDREMTYLGCNTQFARDAGFEKTEDIIGKDDYAMGWREQAERYRADDRAVIESGQAKLLIEEPQTTPSGDQILLLTSKIPLRDISGAITGVLGIYQDITERKTLEAQLQQSQKMESVGRLAGGVAHDFNNMLSVIIGRAELALMDLSPTDSIYKDILAIKTVANRSADLTRQLLAFARKQTISPKLLNLNSIIESMLTMLRQLIGEDIALIWKPADNLWMVKMDPTQIDQILANLVVNARDAIKDIGMVTIETANVVLDEAYCTAHAGSVPGQYTLLSVSDNGCGMNPETMASIFEPFFTTKPIGMGTGLGLAMVYGIVKQNNGFIDVHSEPGKGTTFQIYQPRYVGKAAQTSSEAEEAAATGGPETILLVEDEPEILEVIRMILIKLGYQLLAAATPGEAIRLAEDHAGTIHLLMTDVIMPEMNGRDLAKRLLALYPDLKRLFMSGYTADVIAHHGILEEGVHFIQKPFSIADLAAKVRAALD